MIDKLLENELPVSLENVKKVPERPGIYCFLNFGKKPVYIGKSVNLKKRLLSYLALNLDLKTGRMIKEAKYFKFIFVNSEIESLLLEANLIRMYKPQYNIELKDDKHPIYIKITKEKFPRILLSRKIQANEIPNLKGVYGPFPSTTNVKMVLKTLRRIFPYANHKPEKRPCIYSQIGLCDPCPSIIENSNNQELVKTLATKYRKNINMAKNFLDGRIIKVKEILTREMSRLAVEQKFEEAAKLKTKIDQVDYVTSSITPSIDFIENPNLVADMRTREVRELKEILGKYFKLGFIDRVECFDIAHLAGTKPTASMVTFVKGEPDKNLYRRFRIKQKKGNDDIASLAEVATRRSKHFADWGMPDLIVVDGGKGQSRVFDNIFRQLNIPVIGLAKRFETLIIPLEKENFSEIRLRKGPALNFFQRIRNEAHRFARSYHHKLISKNLLS